MALLNPGKEVVEEVSGWLRVYDDGSVDRTWTGPEVVNFLIESIPPSDEFVDGVATRDVIIDEEFGAKVRIYIPEDVPQDAKLPLLVHFHGGGFCISRPDFYMYCQFYAKLVKAARVICVSVWLRLAPENRLPAAMDDAFAGLMWVRSVARAELTDPWLSSRADFGRVVLIGDSSGGNVVHAMAARTGEEDMSPLVIRGAIPIHPGFVRATRSKSELDLKSDSAFLTLDMVDKFLALSLPIGSTKDHPITCPMGDEAPPVSELKLPDILLPVAENDLIRDTELEYYEAIKKAGKNIELYLTPGLGHCFYLNKIAVDADPNTAEQTDKLIMAICSFIEKH